MNVFQLSELPTPEMHALEEQKIFIQYSNMKCTVKNNSMVWIQSEDVLSPYYFDNETVGNEDYFELFDTYVRQEPQKFP